MPLNNLVILYAGDLLPDTQIAPGGINSCLLNFIAHFPSEIPLVAWGAGGQEALRCQGHKTYHYLPFCKAEPLNHRKIPLNLRYTLALTWRLWVKPKLAEGYSVMIAHRMEYLLALRLLRNSKLPPVVLYIHSPAMSSRLTMSWWKALIYENLERFAISFARSVILVSQNGLEQYQKCYPQWANKMFHVPNAVDSDVFHPQDKLACRTTLGLPPEAPIFCYHGRMEHEKGVGLLLETFACIQRFCPEAHLLLVGDGRERRQMEAQAEELNLHHVHFVGAVPHTDVGEYLGATDVSLLTSRIEGMSMGVLESLSCGVPVVATGVGDNARLIQENISGEIVSIPEPEKIAEAALRVYKSCSKLREGCIEIASAYQADGYFNRIQELNILGD